MAIMICPGLIAAALARIADAAMRNSIYRGSMEMLYYMALPSVPKSITAFLDVVVERSGDASAGFIILLVDFASLGRYRPYVHFNLDHKLALAAVLSSKSNRVETMTETRITAAIVLGILEIVDCAAAPPTGEHAAIDGRYRAALKINSDTSVTVKLSSPCAVTHPLFQVTPFVGWVESPAARVRLRSTPS